MAYRKEMERYRLEDNRFHELQRAVWQYPDWKEKIAESSYLSAVSIDGMPHGTNISDPTAELAASCERELRKVGIVNRVAELASSDSKGVKDEHLEKALLKYVTTRGCTFQWLKTNGHIFYEGDKFYAVKWKFYWLLDKFWN